MEAYQIPIGTEIVIGKRRWRLVHRMKNHPDIMRFTETTEGEHDPMYRGMYPSEVQDLMDKGCSVSRAPLNVPPNRDGLIRRATEEGDGFISAGGI